MNSCGTNTQRNTRSWKSPVHRSPIHTHVYIYIFIYLSIYIYIYTHTHTHIHLWWMQNIWERTCWPPFPSHHSKKHANATRMIFWHNTSSLFSQQSAVAAGASNKLCQPLRQPWQQEIKSNVLHSIINYSPSTVKEILVQENERLFFCRKDVLWSNCGVYVQMEIKKLRGPGILKAKKFRCLFRSPLTFEVLLNFQLSS